MKVGLSQHRDYLKPGEVIRLVMFEWMGFIARHRCSMFSVGKFIQCACYDSDVIAYPIQFMSSVHYVILKNNELTGYLYQQLG